MKRDEIYYQAMLARDHRFDGKFFVGVKTTGIYCRPICPARPKRENVIFFKNHIAAENAGYRPCLRCRPESAPRSPAWIGKSAIVKRAVKAMNDSNSIHATEDEFAARFGVSARHLRRIFMEEIGKTPKQLASENRLNLARKLVLETSLPITEIAFASGFSSIRRFNDAFKDRFKRKPSQIRRTSSREHAGIRISLAYRPPFNYPALLRTYESHRIGDLEWFEDGKMNRVVEFEGKVGKITISNDPEKSQLWVEMDVPATNMIPPVISRVRNLFDLDSDPVLVANSLELDPEIKKLLKKHPGIRLPSGWDPFEIAVSTILGQLVSVERGRALVENLIEILGKPSGLTRNGREIKLFPTPTQIATSTLSELKTTAARKLTLVSFAQAVEQGQLSLEPTQDVDDFIKNVTAIKGIGAWTANYMALKVLRHTDSFPATDLILARALEIHPKDAIEQMSPWRGYVAALLWRAYYQEN